MPSNSTSRNPGDRPRKAVSFAPKAHVRIYHNPSTPPRARPPKETGVASKAPLRAYQNPSTPPGDLLSWTALLPQAESNPVSHGSQKERSSTAQSVDPEATTELGRIGSMAADEEDSEVGDHDAAVRLNWESNAAIKIEQDVVNLIVARNLLTDRAFQAGEEVLNMLDGLVLTSFRTSRRFADTGVVLELLSLNDLVHREMSNVETVVWERAERQERMRILTGRNHVYQRGMDREDKWCKDRLKAYGEVMSALSYSMSRQPRPDSATFAASSLGFDRVGDQDPVLDCWDQWERNAR